MEIKIHLRNCTDPLGLGMRKLNIIWRYITKANNINEYRYWIDKVASYGHEEAIKLNVRDNVHKEEISESDTKQSNRKFEGFIWIIGGILLTILSTAITDGGVILFYGAVLYGLYLVIFK